MTSRMRSVALALAVIGLMAAATGRARAEFVVVFDTNYQLANPSPAGTAPWLRATFADEVVDGDLTGDVLVTLENLLNDAGARIGAVAFNQAATVTSLRGSHVSGRAGTFVDRGGTVSGWGAAGRFDFGFRFPTGDGDRFGMGDISTFRLTAGADLHAADFRARTDANSLAAAHVQSIGPGGTSTKISGIASVPEPASVAMLGTSVIVGLGVAWRRRRAA